MAAINDNSEKVRILKVYDKMFIRGGNTQYNRYSVLYPEIRLMGQWLADCGFRPGQSIEVVQEEGRLTIRKVER